MRHWFAISFSLVVFPASAAEPTLEQRLKPLIEAHQGKVAVAVKHLGNGVEFRYHADDPMSTASLIKFPVMVEAYRQAGEKKISLDKSVIVKKGDRVQGSGILTAYFSEGASFPLRDAITLMIAVSDNTATNLVLDQIGLGSTAAAMEVLGCPNTKIHSKVFKRDTSVFPERSKQFGLGSTTANEMLRLFEALNRGELVSKEASAAMTATLKKCDDKHKFRRFLPPGVSVAYKTGSVDDARTAAGILYAKSGPIALCVLTNENKDHTWVDDNAGDLLCAKIALEVFKHFNPTSEVVEKKAASK